MRGSVLDCARWTGITLRTGWARVMGRAEQLPLEAREQVAIQPRVARRLDEHRGRRPGEGILHSMFLLVADRLLREPSPGRDH
jgi:hypothetical protein